LYKIPLHRVFFERKKDAPKILFANQASGNSGEGLPRKAISGILLTLLLAGMLSLEFNIHPVRTEPTTLIVPKDYPTIQAAINAAGSGSTIFVRNGTYNENIVINKMLFLVGENWEDTV
jgi:hypothetical protein